MNTSNPAEILARWLAGEQRPEDRRPTDQCVTPLRLARLSDAPWTQAEESHIRGCAYCLRRIAGFYRSFCPDRATLQAFVVERPRLAVAEAVAFHLENTTCPACSRAVGDLRAAAAGGLVEVAPPAVTAASRGKVIAIRSVRNTLEPGGQTLAAAAHARNEPGWPVEAEVTSPGTEAPVRIRFSLTAKHVAVVLADTGEARRVRLYMRNLPFNTLLVTHTRQILGPEGLLHLDNQSSEAEIRKALLAAGLEVDVE